MNVRAGTQPQHRREPAYLMLLRGLLYAFSLYLYLRTLSSVAGIVVAGAAAMAAVVLAQVAHRDRLRPLAAFVLSVVGILGALSLGDRLLNFGWAPDLFGVRGAFIVADILIFGVIAFLVVFLLRLLALRLHLFSLAEVLFVTGSVAVTMADHRNRMLNRPRFFSDWAWSVGLDPSVVLIAIGAALAVGASLLFIRRQPLLKLLTTASALALLGGAFFLISEQRIEAAVAADALGLSGKQPNQDGQGNGSNELFKDDYRNKKPPKPVAVMIFRDDYESSQGIVYLRQRVVSYYNGHRLIANERMDKDVFTQVSETMETLPSPVQSTAHHLLMPTTMYLLVDHPQPPALTHAVQLKAVDNPNPSQFVNAYEVQSMVLSVPPARLIGHQSIPKTWMPERTAYYTAVPDDPRYETLADEIVRGVDPRFVGDDMAKALAIKAYLEREGFYTLKSKHSNAKDPTASFLFGSLRGYCVHFAHAATYMLRTQGIAARVALGYAVQTMKHSGGSSVLVMGDRAHAWPEVFLDGIGWVTLDIYPAQTDMPPPTLVDYDLEKLLGELARQDPTAGISPTGEPLKIPWQPIAHALLLCVLITLGLAYVTKLYRQMAPKLWRGERRLRTGYRAILDRLAELGLARDYGETREQHARRVETLSPHFATLTHVHLGRAFGSQQALSFAQFQQLSSLVRADLVEKQPRLRRVLAWLNPIAWLHTR